MIEENVRKLDNRKETMYVFISIFLIFFIAMSIISFNNYNSKKIEHNDSIYNSLNTNELETYNFIDELVFQREKEIIDDEEFFSSLMHSDNFSWIKNDDVIYAISKKEEIGNFAIKDNKIFYSKVKMKDIKKIDFKNFNEIIPLKLEKKDGDK